MRKAVSVFLTLALAALLCACGSVQGTSDIAGSITSEPGTGQEAFVDLTALSSTLVYAEVYNMMTVPESYIGKRVKMSGEFSAYLDEATGKMYFSCIIADATACCSQGIEFVLNGNKVYPDDYPEPGSMITVTGIFNTYDEDGYVYCELKNAEIVI